MEKLRASRESASDVTSAVQGGRKASGDPAEPRDGLGELWAGLTPREWAVVEWLVQGLSNPQIASRLNISPRTVQKHLQRTFKKLGVQSRGQLAARCMCLRGLPGNGISRPISKRRILD